MIRNLFFSADHHFFHKKIIEKQSSRSRFASLEEMHEMLIEGWNRKVPHNGIVYYMGDLAFRCPSAAALIALRRRLNGKIHAVWGNHDATDAQHTFGEPGMFESGQDVLYLRVNNQRIFMSHYAHRVWRGSNKGSWHLFGHSHGHLSNINRSMDVGVDTHPRLEPYSWDEIKITLESQPLTNHHPVVDDD